ncbi:methyltransferase-like protein 27 [Cynoglossus semilaevis]|nr:methyltransferase-like protein 27 [Cynoglossus semilaevis]
MNTVSEIVDMIRSIPCPDSKATVQFYDSWAENYDKDISLLRYRTHLSAIEFLTEHFSGSREEAVVLDVGCGTGLVAKLMNEEGFKHFTGVDGSQGMLDKAKERGLYHCLKKALLGSDLLPVEKNAFDVVIAAGSLGCNYIPVRGVGEFCQAAKPGGLVCISLGHHTEKRQQEFKVNLEQKLQLMEKEGLWREVGIKQFECYMLNTHAEAPRDSEELPSIPGTCYLYQKC